MAASNLKLGTLIDKLYLAKQAVKKAEAALAKEKKKADAIEQDIIKRFKKTDIAGASGARAVVSVMERVNFNIKDYKKFENFVYRTRAADLLQKRVSSAAVKERLEAGKPLPPGLERFTKVVLSTRTKK